MQQDTTGVGYGEAPESTGKPGMTVLVLIFS